MKKNKKGKRYFKLKQNNKLKSIINKIKPPKVITPKTVQQFIMMLFKDYDNDTNLFRIDNNTYSMCVEYSDISFAKAKKEVAENIFLAYVDYLNSFKNDIHIQVINNSNPIKTEKLKEKFLFNVGQIKESNQELLKREQKMANEFNKLIGNSLGDKEETLDVKRYITLSTEASSYQEANQKLFDLFLKTEEKFSELHSTIRMVTNQERLNSIYNLLNSDTLDENADIDKIIEEKNITIFDFLAPKKMDLKNNDFIVILDEDNHPKKYLSALYLNKFSKSIKPTFYNKITTLQNIEMITSLNITPTSNAKVVKKINKNITGMKSERIMKKKSARRSMLDYEDVKDENLEEKLSETKQLLYDIQKHSQKVFKNNMIIIVTAKTEKELQANVNKIYEIASENIVDINTMKWQQIEGIQHCLPLGWNTIQFQRSLTSEATACNVPFNTKDIMQKTGLYYGINSISKNPLFADRKTLLNGNGCILATSGAGKSFSAKMDIEEVLLKTDDDVMVIDMQKEYQPLINYFSGQTIDLSINSSTYINPFDTDINYGLNETGKSDPIREKTEYIIAFIESIVGNITGGMKTIIDRCTKIIYEPYENSGFQDETLIPNLKMFYDTMLKQQEQEAKNLCLILERYVSGSIDLFAHETNVNINNRFINFDLSNLNSSMQTTGYLVVLDYIMNRLAKNKAKGKYTWIFIDEFHILLANPFSAEYIAKIYKVGRKFLAIPTIITQNIADVLNSVEGRKILSNSEFAKILKQQALDLPAICSIFDISNDEAKFITGRKHAEGLLVFNQDKYPFSNQVPKEYDIYKINNTSIELSA